MDLACWQQLPESPPLLPNCTVCTFVARPSPTPKAHMDSAIPTPSTRPIKELKAESGNRLNATRYCFRVRVEDLPGPPLGRSITLANDFLRRNFHRSFSWDTDYVYTPVNIDGQGKPGSCSTLTRTWNRDRIQTKWTSLHSGSASSRIHCESRDIRAWVYLTLMH
jgi:hypothetical protein